MLVPKSTDAEALEKLYCCSTIDMKALGENISTRHAPHYGILSKASMLNTVFQYVNGTRLSSGTLVWGVFYLCIIFLFSTTINQIVY